MGQRTLQVLFTAIQEARRCVDCILMVMIHYICGAAQVFLIVSTQALLCLPAPLEGIHVLAFILLLLPPISLSLLFSAASPTIMKELPLKKADEKTMAQPGTVMMLYLLRSVPSAFFIIGAFVHDLHRVFTRQLDTITTPSACDNLSWHWWVTGQWPACVAAAGPGAGRGWLWDSGSGSGQPICALAHAQQWCGFLFCVYQGVLSFTFLDRYDSLATRGPLSNKVLCSVAVLMLVAHTAVSVSVVVFSCGSDWREVLVPDWDMWIIWLCIWPLVAIVISEYTKRTDRRSKNKLQRRLRALFNTRLGMWSPK